MTTKSGTTKFTGKYRGSVVSNTDPLRRGRLLVKVSEGLGELPAFWAEAATPLAGLQSGMFVTPQPNAGVWVEFEKGDLGSPVWTGFWAGSQLDTPAEAHLSPGVPSVVLATSPLNVISINDKPGPAPGGIMLRHGTAFIAINDTGIQISNGQGATIILGPGPLINVNGGALTVLS
ncbi:phage baseplate assembly protein V [Amycolatopsis suaedae]|uniref:Baseplate assembly protein n=1 Tax=Amycolatopsis suaedae TaxID=2510978 RepID=A0A4Q7IYI0_9PSEU|nr:phage baseplate assembly protein V [Amycolatopsis suaedae]RZQ60041.1 baseplate assembly protein [Amycolatopsis suaedae]